MRVNCSGFAAEVTGSRPDRCRGRRSPFPAVRRPPREESHRSPASAMSPGRRRPGRHRLMFPQLFLAVRRQQLRRHPEVVTGHATQRNAINRTVGAGQREAISDLGRDLTFRARYDSQRWSHLLTGYREPVPLIYAERAPGSQIPSPAGSAPQPVPLRRPPRGRSASLDWRPLRPARRRRWTG